MPDLPCSAWVVRSFIVQFRLLGLLEVTDDDGRQVEIVRGRESSLLALMLLHANAALSTERIIEELWAGAPPENARKSVHIYVSRLRKALGADRIRTTPAGYVLRVRSDELDMSEFESLAAEGRRALDESRSADAEQVLDKALALWRVAPLAEFRFEAFAASETRRLEELHDVVVADRIDARIACGRARTVIGELEVLIERAPLWERPRAQLMRALYLAGRQADALALYRRTRVVLDEELGVEPGPELQRLERQILNQDPELGEPVPPPRPTLRKRRLQLATVTVVVLATAAIVVATALSRGGGRPALAIAHNSVAVIDPRTERLVADIPVGDGPGRLIAGGGNVWSLNIASRTVSRIDVTRINAVRTFAIGRSPGDIAYGHGSLWTAEASRRTLDRIDPATGITVGSVTPPVPDYPETNDGGEVAYASDAVWFGSNHATVTRVDPSTLRVVKTIHSLDVGPGGEIVASPDAVWVDDSFGNVTLIDPHTNDAVAEAHLSTSDVGGIAVSAHAVWATAVDQGLLWELDPTEVQPINSFPVGPDPLGVALGAESVWVANAGGTLTRLDPSSGKTTTIRLAGSPDGVAFANGLVWVGID